MGWLSREEIKMLGFGFVGDNVQIGRSVLFVRPDKISIGHNSRIDDYCTLVSSENWIKIGKNVHIGSHSHLAGAGGIEMHDFSGLSQGVRIYSASDDYSGSSLTNPTVPIQYKNVAVSSVVIGKHAIIGSNSVVTPGCNLGEGAALGALSLLTKQAEEWSIYFGSPAKKIKSRKKNLLKLELAYLKATAP
jgi:galactoside O-acetyltransferase